MLTKIRRQEQKNILNLFPLKKAILVTWIRFFFLNTAFLQRKLEAFSNTNEIYSHL